MTVTNNQTAPYPQVLEDLVKDLKYREGWQFDMDYIDRGQGSCGLTLIVMIDCADTYAPDTRIHVRHFMPVPPASFNEESWRRWLLDQILLVERHEACEFFQIGDKRPYAPHHGFGMDPYIVWDHGEIQDARTDYRNQKRSTDSPHGDSC